jgi:hypothetical protein
LPRLRWMLSAWDAIRIGCSQPPVSSAAYAQTRAARVLCSKPGLSESVRVCPSPGGRCLPHVPRPPPGCPGERDRDLRSPAPANPSRPGPGPNWAVLLVSVKARPGLNWAVRGGPRPRVKARPALVRVHGRPRPMCWIQIRLTDPSSPDSEACAEPGRLHPPSSRSYYRCAIRVDGRRRHTRHVTTTGRHDPAELDLLS